MADTTSSAGISSPESSCTPVSVKVATAPEPVGHFVLTLANGRRIESAWRFTDAELARLIRVVESA